MASFKKGSREMPEMNTSSLPDLIFSILFFFMMVTTMREVTVNVEINLPKGTEIEKLEKRTASFIYIGSPTKEYQAKLGRAPRIQLNNKFADPSEIKDFVAQERLTMNDPSKQVMSLKIDAGKVHEKTGQVITKGVTMGLVDKVKQELRKSYALKINYTADSME